MVTSFDELPNPKKPKMPLNRPPKKPPNCEAVECARLATLSKADVTVSQVPTISGSHALVPVGQGFARLRLALPVAITRASMKERLDRNTLFMVAPLD